MLVYWPLEGCVTTFDSAAVSSGNDIGSSCIVTSKEENFKGRIAAKGNKKYVQLFVQYRNSEMEQLEDDFVAGKWIKT